MPIAVLASPLSGEGRREAEEGAQTEAARAFRQLAGADHSWHAGVEVFLGDETDDPLGFLGF